MTSEHNNHYILGLAAPAMVNNREVEPTEMLHITNSEPLTRKKGQVFDHLGEIVSPAFGENQVQSLTPHVRDGNPKSEAHEHVKSKELIEVGEKVETLKRRVLVAPTTESKTPEKDMSRSVIMGAKDEDHVELDIDRFKQVLVERDNNSGWTMETKLFQEKVVVSSLDTHERLATIEKVVIESNWPDADGENETLLDTLEHVVYHDDLELDRHSSQDVGYIVPHSKSTAYDRA